jgi:hypothetical protein
MGDNTEQQTKKRRSKWTTFYSNMTIPQAEKRLGFRLASIKAISVDRMLANAKYSLGGCSDAILKTKEKVYDGIVEHLEIEGYPTEANPDLKKPISATWSTSPFILYSSISNARRDAPYAY